MIHFPKIYFSTNLELVEQDCACPDGGFESLHSTLSSRVLWRTATNLYRAPLPQNHQVIFQPLGSSKIAVLNPAAQELLDGFKEPCALDAASQLDAVTKEVLEQFIAFGLLQPYGSSPQNIPSQAKTLTAWIHTTNECNLRCKYCYLHKTNSGMNEETGRAAIDAVFRSAVKHSFQAVKFKYAGGEATLNFALIRTLHGYAKQSSVENQLQLREVVLSNGVGLTRSMIEFLRDENIRLMISLDGIGAAHDAQRVFANGRGSFIQVRNSIERAHAAGLEPHLSITVTAKNADSLADAVQFALDRDLPFNLNFFRDNECVTSHGDLAMDHARLITGMKRAFDTIELRLPRRRVIDSLVDRSSFDTAHEYACGAGHNYMVIDERGCVARCQMEIERTVTDVFADDPLAVVRSVRDGFQNIPVHQKSECSQCEWQNWCAGGCSLLVWRATGRSDLRSPYCNVYKALYPDVVRLEGLRLMKYSSVEA